MASSPYSTESFVSPDGLSKSLVLNRSLASLDGHIRSVVGGFVHPGCESIREAEEQHARRDEQQLPDDDGQCAPFDRALHAFTTHPSRHGVDDRPASSEWRIHTPSQSQWRVHLFLMMTAEAAADLATQTGWAHVGAVAQICADGAPLYREGLASLCCHVTQVFLLQPTRLYVHGLYIRGSTLELWVFDRAGAYRADAFDIDGDPARYAAVVLGYTLMDPGALGHSRVITRASTATTTTTTTADHAGAVFAVPPSSEQSQSPPVAIPVSDTPFVRVMGLVGSGLVCYRAQEHSGEPPDRVLKLKWRVVDDMPEEGPLQKARDRDVWGIVRLEHYGELERTADLRQAIEFGPPLRLIVRRSDDAPDSNEGGLEAHTDPAGDDEGGSIPHRVLCFHVLYPLGRPLSTFRTREELLQTFHDAIKAHRSLLQSARILHRDVSEDNIVIVDDPSDSNSPKGMLIDLDSALDLDVGPNNRRQITGTRAFMSIGILLKQQPHTYRHDLESFLYVFLHAVVTDQGPGRLPEDSKLQDWSRGTWGDSAREKARHMDKGCGGGGGFASVLDEFPEEHECLKPLAEELRDVLFTAAGSGGGEDGGGGGGGEGGLFTGTDGAGEDRVYDGMIGAFERALLRERDEAEKG